MHDLTTGPGRLLFLADYLMTLPDKADFALLGDESDPPTGFSLVTWRCGTTACAVGHACYLPQLKEQGLGWNGTAPTFHHREAGHLRSGWGAVMKFFNLGDFEAERLFDLSQYSERSDTSPHQVAARIRALVGVEA